MRSIALTIFVIITLIPVVAIGGNIAPYTKDAVEKIFAVQKSIEPPKYDPNDSHEERARKWVEYNRSLFRQAGYDFDETTIQVVDDMRYHRERLPQGNANDSVFGYIYVSLNMMLSDCKYYKVDCMKLFSGKMAESVKWLSENTSFSF